jgi:hypothetical protein
MRKVDLTVDRCRVCGLRDAYIYTGEDASGDVFTFDICETCEQGAHKLMTDSERLESLYRWTFGDRR